jgi:hypothetical protein
MPMDEDEIRKVITDEVQAKVGEVVSLLFSDKVPCMDIVGTDTCIERLSKGGARPGKRVPWHAYDDEKMCASCAAYWHAQSAQNRLARARRNGSFHGL